MKRLIICEKKRIYHGLVVEDDFDFTAAIENAKTNDRDYVDVADILSSMGKYEPAYAGEISDTIELVDMENDVE